jgi:hypothetical protein
MLFEFSLIFFSLGTRAGCSLQLLGTAILSSYTDLVNIQGFTLAQ